MKKIISVLISIFVLSSVCLTVYAESYTDNMSVFGDEISAGYGLYDYSASDLSASKKNFVNIIADENNLKFNENYYNFSQENVPSSDVLEKVLNCNPSIIQKSDSIIISMFTESMKDAFQNLLITAVGSNSDKFESLGAEYNFDSFENSVRTLSILYETSKTSDDAKELYNEISSAFSGENSNTIIQMVCSNCRVDLREMLIYIYDTQNSNADVYILDVFDLLGGINLGDEISPFGNSFCEEIRNIINEEVSYNPEKVHLIDVYENFKNNESNNTNNSYFDFNVNENGHSVIAGLLKNTMSSADKGSENSVVYSEENIIGQVSYSNDESPTSVVIKEASGIDDSVLEASQEAGRKAYLGVMCAVFIGFAAIASIAGINYGKNKK